MTAWPDMPSDVARLYAAGGGEGDEYEPSEEDYRALARRHDRSEGLARDPSEDEGWWESLLREKP